MSSFVNTPACLWIIIVSLTLSFLFSFSIATGFLTPATSLFDGQTLVSSGGAVKFELGFFSPSNASNARYLGIWYKRDPTTIVWVANRDNPITEAGAFLRVWGDGQLLIFLNQTEAPIWSSNSSKLAQDPRAQLLETGNFVVMDQSRNGSSGNYLWQSFDNPTDTFLPGGRIGRGLNDQDPEVFFTSWKSPNDPSSGDFVYRFIYRGLSEQVINNGSIRKYRTGPWNGVTFSGFITFKQAGSVVLNFHDNMLYNLQVPFSSSLITRIVIDSSGHLNSYLFDEASSGWKLLHTVPHDECENYGKCGVNGICSVTRRSNCECLKGFAPKVPVYWERRDRSDGCVRQVPLNCTKGDGFFKLVGVKLPDLLDFWLDTNMSLKQCKRMCKNNSLRKFKY